MKRIILTAIALIVIPSSLLAATMGQSAGHDLDALWARARSHFDISQEDAVILLESKQVAFSREGAFQTRVHRVVWVGTTVGIRGYADLRIPWNSETSTLDVEILRTWRDGRWWPDAEKISDTAVVHTLPHALDRADDYTVMRETMLLHDAVELGCIMETAFTITEQGIPAAGGIFVMPQHDPAVLTELRVMVPPGMVIQHEELNGAAMPASLNPTKGGAQLWQAELSPALGQPATAHPEAYEPAVVWSTWGNWDQLTDHWNAAFAQGMQLDPDQVQGLQDELHAAMSPRQKVAAVGEHLNEMVRRVHYDDRFWRFSPRPASRTLATAYGHDLDRAVLAAALLSEAGVPGEPVFIGQSNALEAEKVPRLQDMGHVALRIPSVLDALLDPTTGQVVSFDEVLGHPFWYVDGYAAGGPQSPVLPQPEMSLTVGFNLEQAEEDSWQGKGFFRGTSLFSHYGQMQAAGDLKDGYLSGLAGSVLPGSKLSGAAPGLLRQDAVEVSLVLSLPELATDGLERKSLVVGNPQGGVLGQLPAGVHLYEEIRHTPVMGMENWQQSVTVRIEVGEDTLLHKPEPKSLVNAAGQFELQVGEENGWLTLTRTLQLADHPIAAAGWSDLRALLLEEADPVNGTVLFK